jgi:hypothetical protein
MKLKLFIILLNILIASFTLSAQNRQGSLDTYLNNYIDNLPGNSGNNYTKPNVNQLNTWSQTIDAILSNNISLARSIAVDFNYQIIAFTDTIHSFGQAYYILEEKSPRIYYWGTYIFSSAPCRNKLIIQSPHPRYDTNTGKQGVFCFSRLNAKALFLSGTHRCNNDTLSNCSGQTKACSSSYSAYRISDNAHNINTAFQKTTERILLNDSSAVFVQLHGFSKKSTDPYIIMSNGTRFTPTHDYVSMIKDELKKVDTSLTFKIAHINTTWTRLIAFTNTQGRFINKSADACTQAATISKGGFVHMEQEKTKLRQDSTAWYKMYIALSEVFSCNTNGFSESNKSENKVSIFPNPCNENYIEIKAASITKVEIYDLNGRRVMDNAFNSSPKIRLKINNIQSGMYLIAIESNNQIIYKKLIIQK